MAIILKWFAVEKFRMAVNILFSILMVICLFLDRIDLSIFAVLMLILMEIEKISRIYESKS
jgi:hypothetical protein